MQPMQPGQGPLKRPESVLVVVFTLAGEVLLLRRADDAGFWQSVTGSLEADEVPAAAASRELHEETGLICDQLEDCRYSAFFDIRPRWRHRYPPGTTRNLEHVFLAVYPQSAALTVQLSPAEHTEYRWLPASEAIALCWSETNRAAIERFVLPRLAPQA